MRRHKGIVIATAAASLILTGTVVARAEQEKAGGDTVHCAGVNACKGQGVCAGPESSCAGMNTCKGKGVAAMSAEECTKKGGKVVEKQM